LGNDGAADKDKVFPAKLGKVAVNPPKLTGRICLKGCQNPFQCKIFETNETLIVVVGGPQHHPVIGLSKKDEFVPKCRPFPNPIGTRRLFARWDSNRSGFLTRRQRSFRPLGKQDKPREQHAGNKNDGYSEHS